MYLFSTACMLKKCEYLFVKPPEMAVFTVVLRFVFFLRWQMEFENIVLDL
jgi:hypothetical protein